MRGRVAAGLAAAAVALCATAPAQAAQKPFPGAGKLVLGSIPQEQLQVDDMRRMGRNGLDSVRIAINWPEVERSPGTFRWSHVDALVATAALGKVRLLPYLYGSPGWAVSSESGCVGGGCTTYAPATKASRGAFARFAAEAVRQYGPGGRFWAAHPELPYRPMRAWQIWNEQNSPKYYAPAPAPDHYARLVSAAAGAIRGVDRRARVILGGMWGPMGQTDVVPAAPYLRRLYRQPGARASFEGIAVHPYHRTVGGMLRQIVAARQVARAHRDRRASIWLTELGWASKGPKGHRLVRGRRGQAKILQRAYHALAKRRARWRIRAVYWYAWSDSQPGAAFVCKWCPGAGLRTATGKVKPSWRAMKRVARRHSMPK